MITVNINAEPGWYITYKRGDGRAIAYPQRFDSQEQAQRKLDTMGYEVNPPTDFNETMHVVEKVPALREKDADDNL